MKFDKRLRRKKVHSRVRRKIKGSPERPRLTVFRSNKSIYCQVVDDHEGITLAAASSLDEGVDRSLTKKEQARQVGKLIGERAQKANVSNVVFDRGGYLYHGRVKELAEGAREAGLHI
ncbi:MAG: 50S ribosomal protein L18 [Saprospiraceae bacterium]|jgi:large subunit ribosomal protein L18